MIAATVTRPAFPDHVARRIAAAEAAVRASGRALTSGLPFEQRYDAGRASEAALLERAEARAEAGTATVGDQQLIAAERMRGQL